jgi:hypothetical protein
LRAIAADESEPPNFRRIAGASADHLDDALEARLAGNDKVVNELILGQSPDGSVSRHSLKAILPKWARSTTILDALAGAVVPDPHADPPSMTIHWEKVPRDLRQEAASLASEWVDVF